MLSWKKYCISQKRIFRRSLNGVTALLLCEVQIMCHIHSISMGVLFKMSLHDIWGGGGGGGCGWR